MNIINVVMGGLAFFCFILASVLALLRYKRDHGITNVCLLMGAALFLFSIYSLLNIFYYRGFYMDITENIKGLAFVVGSVFLFSSVMCTLRRKGLF